MPSLPVVADAPSRLHADVAITRLIRAGIRADHVSALFPQRRAPNAVCCWLKNFHPIPGSTCAQPIAGAGILGRLFKTGFAPTGTERHLDALGFEPAILQRFAETLEEGSIVLCVHARNENEAAVAWHVFHHVDARNITCPNLELGGGVERDAPVLSPQWASVAA